MQRFRSDECRKIFQQGTPAYAAASLGNAGPTTLPAVGQPSQNKTLPQSPCGRLHSWQTGVLDISNSERTEFVMALKDGETAGTRTATWPAEVRALMDQHVNLWVEENKQTRTVRAMTMAAPKYDDVQSCVLILHHKPKHEAVLGNSSEGKALHGVLDGRTGVS